MSILSEILATKRTEVDCKRRRTPLDALRARIASAAPPSDFRGALVAASDIALIAEVKKASPSKGVIRENFDAIEIARTYAENGATCLSVLTDEMYFQGKLEYLQAIRQIVSLPLLRKDFIIDPWQLYESRAAGADAILLIVAALRDADLQTLLDEATSLGLAALVEVHDRSELETAAAAGANLIGINNRDLHTFRSSLTVTIDILREARPGPDTLIVSESGIVTAADVDTLRRAGVDAFLVGEALMRQADIGAKMRELLTFEEAAPV